MKKTHIRKEKQAKILQNKKTEREGERGGRGAFKS